MKITIEISKDAIIHAIEEIEMITDEFGPGMCSYPPSAKWSEFQNAIRNGYEDALSNDKDNSDE